MVCHEMLSFQYICSYKTKYILMIRLLIIALGIFLIWVMFFSKFPKQRKIVITLVAIVLAVIGLWFEQKGESLKSDLVQLSDVVDCGATGKHSYRTNFDIEFCLQNNSVNATLKRITIDFKALDCIDGACQDKQTVQKTIRLDLSPGEKETYSENLNFPSVDSDDQNIVWTIIPIAVFAN